MASMPFALSVHNFINSVGADAGFAAVVGLAILVLLYFAHARETASLREEAAALSQRLQEAETRLAQAQRVQQAQASEAASAQPVVAARLRAAPAGVAAPALAAATRFIPVRVPQPAMATAAGGPVRTPVPVASPVPAPSPGPAAPPVSPGDPVPAARPAAAPAPAMAASSPQAAPVAAASAAALSGPAPATVAGGANGAGRGAPAGVTEPPLPGGPSRPGGTAPVRRPGTSAAFPRAPGLSSRADAEDRGAWRRFGLLVGALIVVAAAAAAVILTSSTGTAQPSSSTPASNALQGAGFKPSHVTVAVLNGTATNQLAHHVAAGLASQGYKKGVIATASNQTVSKTQVAYLPGQANRTAALHVARALHLPAGAVMPINQAARAVACPPPASCTANVVVTVGSDLAQS